MSNNISRRAVAKGAAWSAPVVMGTSVVPSYASSRELKYRFGQNWSTTYYDRNNCNPEIRVTTDVVRSAFPRPGFAPVYLPREAVDTRAHLEYVEFVVTYPKGLVPGERSWRISNPAWSVKKEPWTWVNLGDGGQADVSKMDVFVFRFRGTMDGRVKEISRTYQSWPDSAFTATASNSNYCVRPGYQVYAGFAYKYTTDNGYTVESTTIAPLTLEAGRN